MGVYHVCPFEDDHTFVAIGSARWYCSKSSIQQLGRILENSGGTVTECRLTTYRASFAESEMMLNDGSASCDLC